MRAALMGTVGFVVGLIVAPVVFFLCYIMMATITDYNDFEGATAMGLATVILPFIALAGGIGGAVLFARVAKQKKI